MSSQGSLVWNTHILNWGATSSSNKTWQPAWLQGREEKWNYLSNIFQCSWLHPNLILEFFSEMNSYMPNMLRARDKLLLILLHANLDPKTVSLDINPQVHHVAKQTDNKLRYTMVYSTSHTSPWYLLPHLPPTRGQCGHCRSSNRQGCRLTMRCLEIRHTPTKQPGDQ